MRSDKYITNRTVSRKQRDWFADRGVVTKMGHSEIDQWNYDVLIKDYQKHNVVAITNFYPLPKINDVLHLLKVAVWFSLAWIKIPFNGKLMSKSLIYQRRHLRRGWGYSNSDWCLLGFAVYRRHLSASLMQCFRWLKLESVFNLTRWCDCSRKHLWIYDPEYDLVLGNLGEAGFKLKAPKCQLFWSWDYVSWLCCFKRRDEDRLTKKRKPYKNGQSLHALQMKEHSYGSAALTEGL